MGQWWVLKILLYVSLCVRACEWVSEWVSEWGSIKLELNRRGEVLACSSSLGGGEGGIETTLCYAFEQALFATSLCIYIWPFGCQRVRIARRGEGREGKERAGLILIVQHYRSRDSSPFLFSSSGIWLCFVCPPRCGRCGVLRTLGRNSVLAATSCCLRTTSDFMHQLWTCNAWVWPAFPSDQITTMQLKTSTNEHLFCIQVVVLLSSDAWYDTQFGSWFSLSITHLFLVHVSTPKIPGWYPNFTLQNVSISLCSLQLLIIRSSPTSFVYNPFRSCFLYLLMFYSIAVPGVVWAHLACIRHLWSL